MVVLRKYTSETAAPGGSPKRLFVHLQHPSQPQLAMTAGLEGRPGPGCHQDNIN